MPGRNLLLAIRRKIGLLVRHYVALYIRRNQGMIHRTAILDRREFVEVQKNALITEYVIIRTQGSRIVLNSYSQIGPFTVIYTGSDIFIGTNVMIGPHCTIVSGNHNFKQTEVPMRFAASISKGPIVIEDDVWVGSHCVITDGVRIGHDAVVGAGSVVTKDVNPYDIVAGVPARVIGSRRG